MLERNISAHKGAMEALLEGGDYIECNTRFHAANSSWRNPQSVGHGQYHTFHEHRGDAPDVFAEAMWYITYSVFGEHLEFQACDACMPEVLVEVREQYDAISTLKVEATPRFWVVRSYIVREYGGAEEGGWHYDRRVIGEVLYTSRSAHEAEAQVAFYLGKFTDPDELIHVVTYVADEPRRLYE